MEQEKQGFTKDGKPDEDTSKLFDTEMLSKEVKQIIEEDQRISSGTLNIDSMKEQSKAGDRSCMSNDDNRKKEDSFNHHMSDSTGFSNGPYEALLSKKRNLQDGWKTYFNNTGRNLLFPLFFLIGTIIYQEIITHFLIYRAFDLKIIYPILFALPFGLLFCFFTGLFSKQINKVILWIVTIAICIVFITQLIYYRIFKVFFSFQSIGMADDAVSEFGKEIILALKENIPEIILLCFPIFILALISRIFTHERRGIKEEAILLSLAALFQIVAMAALLLYGKGDYTPFDLYFRSKVPDLCGKQLGIITMTRIDLGRLMYGDEDLELADSIIIDTEPIGSSTKTTSPSPAQKDNNKPTLTVGPTLPPTPTPIDTSPNVMDIDFAALAAKESKSSIKTLHEYFASVTPTNKNKYTGMFKGYNLIMITAEGFSPYAVHKEKTPTLYKLVREGFVFKNFYTALWQTSTSDGEYVAMTGLIPIGTRSMYHGRKNLWPFSLGNLFNLLGVESKAYHNHTYTYYQRNETHPNLGYKFTGKGNGLVLEHPDVWPESDVEMIESTVDDYIEEDQFHVYYLTVSGHMNYNFLGNSMSAKNRSLVEDLPYSDDVKAYIACQIELDRALELLIKKLEMAGVADRTVIALSADHYPYGWEKDNLDEIAGHELDPYFEVYRNYFILWNSAMTEPIVIDEPCSSMDILPTLLNLFGMEYDSRLLMGQDILSDAPPLVFFSNRSFITELVKYNSETGEIMKLTEDKLPENYVSNINKIIKNKFKVSESILKEDYYRYVFPDYPE